MPDGIDDLNLNPNEIANPPAEVTPPGDTPPAEPAKPVFSLEIDERTRYDDPAKAKEGYLNLKGDRDQHKARAETLQEENRRLKLALGGDPHTDKPKSTMTPEQLEGQRRWLSAVKPELNILTIEDLQRPEVQDALEHIVEKREQARLVLQGKAYVGKTLTEHQIELDEVDRDALEDWLGAVIGHPKSETLRERFLAGDMTVLKELIERRFAAEIKSKAEAAEGTDAARQAARNERGQFARLQDAKDKMKKLPAAPPKGGAAPVKAGEPRPVLTSDQRKRLIEERLSELASAGAG